MVSPSDGSWGRGRGCWAQQWGGKAAGGDSHVDQPLLCGQVLTKQQQEQAASNDFNFDHPDAFDFDLIIATLKKLKQGKSVKIPIYDFTTHSRKKEWVRDTVGGGTKWGDCQGRRGRCRLDPSAFCSQSPTVALCSVAGSGHIFWVSCHGL